MESIYTELSLYELTRGGTIQKHRPGGGQARGGSKPKLTPCLSYYQYKTAFMFDKKLESNHG